jgi:hypothetical protein
MEAEMANWPVQMLIYAAGDGDTSFTPLDAFIRGQVQDLEETVTNRYVNGVLQLDNTTGPTERWVLGKHRRATYEELGETNTGDPNELVEFARWAAARCPSDSLVVIMSGHGMAWEDELAKRVLKARGMTRGADSPVPVGTIRHARRLFRTPLATVDKNTPINTRVALVDANAHDGTGDFLDNSELAKACELIALHRANGNGAPRKIDCLVFDACLMSSWEILTEVRPSVATVVGAIDEISAQGMNLAGAANAITEKRGAVTSQDIGCAFAERYVPATETDSCIAVDIGSERFAAALSHFKAFCQSLLKLMQEASKSRDVHDTLQVARRLTRFHQENVADLAEVYRKFQSFSGLSSSGIASLKSAIETLNGCVIKRSVGTKYKESIGVSIFVPRDQRDYLFNRPTYRRLEFATQSGWDAVLERAFNSEPS